MLSPTKTVTMMDLRRGIGKIVDEAVYQNVTFVVQKRGKSICTIKSVSSAPEESRISLRSNRQHNSLERLYGCLAKTGTADDWSKEYKDIERDYDDRIQQLWRE